jgi:Ran GTPase-activating protein (RanGAP) involved in mRNA processing and transport
MLADALANVRKLRIQNQSRSWSNIARTRVFDTLQILLAVLLISGFARQ